MNSKLNFLTKNLIDQAAKQIDSKGVPLKRDGTKYSAIIASKLYPFKLLITEAASIEGKILTSKEFGSNEKNRNYFTELTGYQCIVKYKMKYLTTSELEIFRINKGKPENLVSENDNKIMSSLSEKLKYFSELLKKEIDGSGVKYKNSIWNPVRKGKNVKNYLWYRVFPSKQWSDLDISLVFSIEDKFNIRVDSDNWDDALLKRKQIKQIRKTEILTDSYSFKNVIAFQDYGELLKKVASFYFNKLEPKKDKVLEIANIKIGLMTRMSQEKYLKYIQGSYEYNCFIIWDKVKPLGKNTIKELRETIKRNGFAELHFIQDDTVSYLVKLIDLATTDHQLQNWGNKNNLLDYHDKLSDYSENNQPASIAYCCSEIVKLEKSILKDSYKLYPGIDYPSSGESSPFIMNNNSLDFNAIKEKRKLTMNKINEYVEILEHKKQIILQGPPGTGKTYHAKLIANEMVGINNSEQLEIIQFHPSYSYEDFVRGISANSVDGNIVYETENKILASFAEKAFNNFISVNKDVDELSREQRIKELLLQFAERVLDIIDDKNKYPLTDFVSITAVESDAFRYIGNWKTSQRMKFKDLILAQLSGVVTRQEIKQVKGISSLAVTHASYYIKVLNAFQKEFEKELSESVNNNVQKTELKKYVLIIDEINRANLPSVLGELIYALEYRNESVNSIYAIEGDYSITLPENLYIIGTMNTADRSVGHIDYAIKRRFAFVDVLPRESVIKNEKSKELFNCVAELFVKEDDNGIKVNSEHLASDFDFKDVQLGHSYFMLKEASEDEQKKELKMRLNYEILPILQEYVKDGLLLESANEIIKKISSFDC
jgi:DNA polymerase III delta prime subunit